MWCVNYPPLFDTFVFYYILLLDDQNGEVFVICWPGFIYFLVLRLNGFFGESVAVFIKKIFLEFLICLLFLFRLFLVQKLFLNKTFKF